MKNTTAGGRIIYRDPPKRSSPISISKSFAGANTGLENISSQSTISNITEPLQFVNSTWFSAAEGDTNNGQVSTEVSETYAQMSTLSTETSTDLSFMPKSTDLSYFITSGKVNDLQSLIAAIEKKPTGIRNLGSYNMSEMYTCMDSASMLSDRTSNDTDGQTLCSVVQTSKRYSSSRSQSKGQKACTIHSPPSVMIGAEFGWIVPLKTSADLKASERVDFSSSPLKPFRAAIDHIYKRSEQQTSLNQNFYSEHPLVNKNYKSSQNLTEEETDDGGVKDRKCYHETISNLPSKGGKDAALFDTDVSVKLKEISD